MADKRSILLQGVAAFLGPIARFCVRHAIRLHDIVELSKQALVVAASSELLRKGEKVTSTKIALMTGVHRKDISRLEKNQAPPESNIDLVVRIVGHWQSDKRFITAEGTPRVLSHEGEKSEFDKLVSSVSKELQPRAVLKELERTGTVELGPRGARLILSSYVPQGDPVEGFRIIGKDFSDLLGVTTDNIITEIKPPHLHARTEFDNIRPDALPEIRRWFLREGHAFHSRVRDFLSQYDQDVNPDPEFEGKGIRTVLGAYSYIDEDETGESKK